VLARTQQTGRKRAPIALSIPGHRDLAATIAATPSEHMRLLTREDGMSFTSSGFGNSIRERCDEAGLPQCSAQRLRRAVGAARGVWRDRSADHVGGRPPHVEAGRRLHRGGAPEGAGRCDRAPRAAEREQAVSHFGVPLGKTGENPNEINRE